MHVGDRGHDFSESNWQIAYDEGNENNENHFKEASILC